MRRCLRSAQDAVRRLCISIGLRRAYLTVKNIVPSSETFGRWDENIERERETNTVRRLLASNEAPFHVLYADERRPAIFR
jgi:hypothetical protein